ncbi:MAG: hypothetical protein ABI585_08260, partial [Betaproteobacteria bacterium]
PPDASRIRGLRRASLAPPILAARSARRPTMPATHASPHADLLRRPAELPISAHERLVAQSQARLAFAVVDAACDAFVDLRTLLAAWRRGLVAARRAR